MSNTSYLVVSAVLWRELLLVLEDVTGAPTGARAIAGRHKLVILAIKLIIYLGLGSGL